MQTFSGLLGSSRFDRSSPIYRLQHLLIMRLTIKILTLLIHCHIIGPTLCRLLALKIIKQLVDHLLPLMRLVWCAPCSHEATLVLLIRLSSLILVRLRLKLLHLFIIISKLIECTHILEIIPGVVIKRPQFLLMRIQLHRLDWLQLFRCRTIH